MASDLVTLKRYMGAYFQESSDEHILIDYIEQYESPTLAAYHLWSQLPGWINVGSVRQHMTGNEQTTFHSFSEVLAFCQKQSSYYLNLYHHEKKIANSLAVNVRRFEF